VKKICRSCLQEKDIKDFPKNGKYPVRSTCLGCWSRDSGNQRKERLLKKYPDRYVECSNDECFNIWAYRIPYKKFTKHVRTCPHCGSVPDDPQETA
jgi:hypothetical protein